MRYDFIVIATIFLSPAYAADPIKVNPVQSSLDNLRQDLPQLQKRFYGAKNKEKESAPPAPFTNSLPPPMPVEQIPAMQPEATEQPKQAEPGSPLSMPMQLTPTVQPAQPAKSLVQAKKEESNKQAEQAPVPLIPEEQKYSFMIRKGDNLISIMQSACKLTGCSLTISTDRIWIAEVDYTVTTTSSDFWHLLEEGFSSGESAPRIIAFNNKHIELKDAN